MEMQWWGPLAAFALVSCITPGPNNLMLTSAGARFGLQRTLLHVVGISAGMGLMLLLVSLGLGELFAAQPAMQWGLRLLGSAYLLWLAWLIGRAGAPSQVQDEQGRPMAFHQAMLFQFVNPKAWMMSLSAISSFTLAGEAYWGSVAWLIGLFCLICLGSCLLWAQFGVQVGQWLKTPLSWRRFNGVMGLLTAACVWMIWR